MAVRIVKERQSIQKRGRKLQQEIEKKEQRTQSEQNRATIDFPARSAGQTSAKSRRQFLAFRLFAKAVTSTGDCVADQTAPDGAKFIVHPNANIRAVGPEQDGPTRKTQGPGNYPTTPARTLAPIHRTPAQ